MTINLMVVLTETESSEPKDRPILTGHKNQFSQKLKKKIFHLFSKSIISVEFICPYPKEDDSVDSDSISAGFSTGFSVAIL